MAEQSPKELFDALQTARAQESQAVETLRQQEAELADELHQKGKSFGHPSYAKYGTLFFLALVMDGLDLLELTGIGWFVAVAIKIPCFLLSLGICWATNTKHKEARSYVEEVAGKIHQIGTVSKFAIKRTAALLRNPAMLITLTEAFGLLLPPILSLFSLNTVWVYIAYRSEKRAYRHAREAADAITA